MCFCGGCFDVDGDVGDADLFGLLMLRSREAGGPTGTMREPNSTPMVTSWCGEKRPSQRRIVNYRMLAYGCEVIEDANSGWLTLDLPHPESPSDTIFAM